MECNFARSKKSRVFLPAGKEYGYRTVIDPVVPYPLELTGILLKCKITEPHINKNRLCSKTCCGKDLIGNNN